MGQTERNKSMANQIEFTPHASFQNESVIVRLLLIEIIRFLPDEFDWDRCKAGAADWMNNLDCNENNLPALKSLVDTYVDDLERSVSFAKWE